MFGNAVIKGAPRPNVLAVPSGAVIRSGTRTLAVVSLGAGRFEPREIELGLDSGDGWLEVRSGLQQGQEVVVSSQFLIDSESNLQEAVQKLLSAGSPDDPDRHPSSPHEPRSTEFPEPAQPAHHGSHTMQDAPPANTPHDQPHHTMQSE